MTVSRWLLSIALATTAACGRWGFPGVASDASDAVGRDGVSILDAPAGSGLVDVTAAAPLLAAPSSLSNDCGRYLISFPAYDLGGQFWHPTVVGIGATAYMFFPCKYGDAGNWSMGLASYAANAPGPPTAAWIDGDASTPGVNEFVHPTDLASSGDPIGSLGAVAVAWNGTSLFGLASTNYNSGGQVTMPVSLAAPDQLAVADFDPTRIGAFDVAHADSTWQGATAFEHSVIYYDGVYDIFTMQVDAPSNETSYIAVDQSKTGADVELATAPLLTGVSHPIATSDADHIYLVAIDDATATYELRVAGTVAGLATATPQPLGLAAFQGGGGAWNHDLFAYTTAGDPRVFGAWVYNGALLLFYLAGTTDYTAATAPYGASRAVGLLSEPLP